MRIIVVDACVLLQSAAAGVGAEIGYGRVPGTECRGPSAGDRVPGTECRGLSVDQPMSATAYFELYY
jgi:hypothetical protein